MKAVTQSRALETREKILRAAARLFALKGYHDTKLEEVLAAAQVTKGAFFHHFRDREDLGFAVLDWHMGQRQRLLDAIEQELSPGQGASPLQRVFRRLEAIQEMARRRDSLRGGASSATSARPSAIVMMGFGHVWPRASTRWRKSSGPSLRRRHGRCAGRFGRTPASWPGTSSPSLKGRSCRPAPSATRTCWVASSPC